jgi:ribonuclease P protein component
LNAITAEFTRQQRILTPWQYKAVFDKRQSQHDSFLGIYVAKNDPSLARLGMVVSKKVSKKAVVRNKIKRQLREYFRHQAPLLKSIDFVVVAKAPIKDLTTAQVHSALAGLIDKVQVRCKK